MYAVGVGKAVEDELREIASEPVEKHFYYTTDFTAISTIAENLKLNVCPGTVTPQDIYIYIHTTYKNINNLQELKSF